MNNWKPLKIGAGGWLTGMDIAPDGTMVVRTDTYGAYIWNGTQWQQLVTSTSMPAGDVSAEPHGEGVYEIKIAPSNTSILYMEYKGGVYRSADKGATWTKTAFAHVADDPNDGNRMDGQKMAVDPSNPNVVYVGTQQNGLFVTTNGGTSWQSVSALPVSGKDPSGFYPGITGIVFDPSSGVTGGTTNVIYASSYGNGVYKSSNGGASWSKLAGGPSDVEYATVSSTGVYYAVGNNETSLWQYKSGAWTQLNPENSQGIHAVMVDPFNASHIVISAPSGFLQESFDGGATWGDGWNWTTQLSASDIPWLATTEKYMSIGGMVFDPTTPNKLWASAGNGVWNTTLPQDFIWSTPIIWNSQSIGIEQLVANDIIVAPGGKPVVASWDRALFHVNDLSTYETTYSTIGQNPFSAGWSVDYASANPNFLVAISDWWGTEQSGYSTDGGQTWHLFPSMPAFAGQTIGGTIAASSATNFIWAPANGKTPYYTTDAGVTWKPVALPGVSDWSTFHWAYYLDKTTVTADRVLPNTFYMYYVGNTNSGVYKTTDGGATWTKTSSGEISAFSSYNSKIEAVPGEAGHLFFTGGWQSGSNPAAQGFYQSTNGGVTWTAVPNVLEVSTFGFGKSATAGGPQAVYIVGYVNNVYGIWQSNDNAQSWTQIGDWPTGSLDAIKTISGDPNIYGQVYVGFSGSGYAYLPGSGGGDLTLNVAAVAVVGSMYDAVGTSAEITKLVTEFLPAQVAHAVLHGYHPLIYASEALGLVFAFGDENGGTAFANQFGPSSAMPNSTAGDAAFAAAAANAIFGLSATVNTPIAIQTWVANWKAFFTINGVVGVPNATADQIDLAARGAAWGDAVGVALANNLGHLPGQVANFLENAAQGTAVYSASLSSQPIAAPFQGAATAPVANVQLIGIGAELDHVQLG